MKTHLTAAALLLSLLATPLLPAKDKPTSLSDARAAVEANMRTPEGKAYDEQQGNEFMRKYQDSMKACKKSAGNDLASFWMLLKLGKDGAVEEVLLYPTTKMGTCARDVLLKARFSPPPRPAFWLGIYMKLAH
jgi:hypothetical protein